MTRPEAIALLGTGLLGGAIAERLHHNGLSVVAYNRTASKTRFLQSQGVAVAEHPEDAVAQADGVILVLTDVGAIRSLLMNPPCARCLAGKAVIQMGTIGPDESLSLQRDLGDLGAALAGRLGHADLAVYNAVQRAAYLGVLVAGVVIVASGLALWKPVQLWWLAAVLGGYEGARYVHFFAMAFIVAFLLVHVVMALLVPRSLRAMIRGR